MAEDHDKDDKNSHKFTFEIEVLNPEVKRRVLECIEKRGKITVTSHVLGAFDGDAGYRQIID